VRLAAGLRPAPDKIAAAARLAAEGCSTALRCAAASRGSRSTGG